MLTLCNKSFYKAERIKIIKMKAFLFVSLIIAIIFSRAADGQKTEIQYLSGTDKDNPVRWDFYCTSGRNSGYWTKIDVPSNWELQGFGSYLYGNVNRKTNEQGLYRHEFSVPLSWENKRIYIVFEGSMTDTEVRINGKPAGAIHRGGFYRFRYDITELLDFRGKNLLEVTVSKESSDESINRAERIADYWVFGGIYRPVCLEAVPLQFIDKVAIDARADGTFYMEVFIEGSGKANKVNAQIFDIRGNPLGTSMSAIPERESKKVIIRGKFADPDLWNPESPNLYKVVVSLNSGRRIIHSVDQKFGFRTVEVRQGDGIYVNGRKVIFRGVCRHTFWPSSGRTSSKTLAIEDVNLMKDMNMNAVRMSHYPPDQFFLDVCDSLGMFVLDELAGWQKFYDTPVAERLVRQMVERDVNHPSVILWDNGNEGGFNKDVRDDYALYDPQKRTVIEPWAILNGINTKHYPGYRYVEKVLEQNSEIYFPTEFLHGIYDGGGGAGLDDYWNLMMSKPLAAGGFLWVFADEGVERKDLKDSIDTNGNRGPDGILGPYHQKEGSFFTIREVWSPVYFDNKVVTEDFNGVFEVSNRFIYTNLSRCSFNYELLKFSGKFPHLNISRYDDVIRPPDIEPGEKGIISLNLPTDWRDYDVLYISATDQYDRKINTWSWNISGPGKFIPDINPAGKDPVMAIRNDGLLSISSGGVEVTFNLNDGEIYSVIKNGKDIPFKGGTFTGFNTALTEIKHYSENNDYVVEFFFDASHIKWTMFPGGLMKLDYKYIPGKTFDYAGITFYYPERYVKGAALLADGPYRVWKNRLKGTLFGLYEKEYNNTITGESWDYPEFKGYYSDFYALELRTIELPVTVFSETAGLFLHLFTPGKAKYSETGVSGNVNPPFPDGDISFLHGISPIGTKFSGPDDEGPQGQKNEFDGNNGPMKGTLYFGFGITP